MTAFTQTVTITTASAVAPRKWITATGGETLNAQDGYGGFKLTSALAQTLRWREAPTALRTTTAALSQAVTAAPADLAKFIWGRVLRQALGVHLTSAAQTTYHVADGEIVRLAQLLRRAYPVVLSQTVSVAQSQALAMALVVLQRLRLLPAQAPITGYHLALAQALTLDSAVGRFLGLHLDDALAAADAVRLRYTASPVLSQHLGVVGDFGHTLALRLTSTLDLTPAQVLGMVYRGDALLDAIDLNGLFVTPGGRALTWAINTRTNAITEYSNYAFNSFAQMGLKYVAASADGIYELDGDDDDGVDIVAEIQSGLMRLNATKLAGLKGVYLALRGGGQFFLKLIAGDGRQYVYEVVAQPDLMTTKINVGKGLRSTFIGFNLKSVGQDFDLDALEFVPMLSDRRV